MFKKGNSILIGVVILAILVGAYLLLSSRGEDGQVAMEDEGQMESNEITSNQSGQDEGVTEGVERDEENSMAMDEVGGDSMMKTSFSGSVIAGDVSPLIDFNQADYEKALAEKKLIVLYFFANWCLTCKKEVSEALYPSFNELENESVVGFRVNYNDNQTDDDEKSLARQFGVAYQHTKVFLKNGERVLKSPESWSKGRYLEEIAKRAE